MDYQRSEITKSFTKPVKMNMEKGPKLFSLLTEGVWHKWQQFTLPVVPGLRAVHWHTSTQQHLPSSVPAACWEQAMRDRGREGECCLGCGAQGTAAWRCSGVFFFSIPVCPNFKCYNTHWNQSGSSSVYSVIWKVSILVFLRHQHHLPHCN